MTLCNSHFNMEARNYERASQFKMIRGKNALHLFCPPSAGLDYKEMNWTFQCFTRSPHLTSLLRSDNGLSNSMATLQPLVSSAATSSSQARSKEAIIALATLLVQLIIAPLLHVMKTHLRRRGKGIRIVPPEKLIQKSLGLALRYRELRGDRRGRYRKCNRV